jgi:hypothetical protein
MVVRAMDELSGMLMYFIIIFIHVILHLSTKELVLIQTMTINQMQIARE